MFDWMTNTFDSKSSKGLLAVEVVKTPIFKSNEVTVHQEVMKSRNYYIAQNLMYMYFPKRIHPSVKGRMCVPGLVKFRDLWQFLFIQGLKNHKPLQTITLTWPPLSVRTKMTTTPVGNFEPYFS